MRHKEKERERKKKGRDREEKAEKKRKKEKELTMCKSGVAQLVIHTMQFPIFPLGPDHF